MSSVSGFFAVTDQCICVDETIECAWLLCMKYVQSNCVDLVAVYNKMKLP